MYPVFCDGYKRFLQSLKSLLYMHLSALMLLSLFRVAFFLSSGYHLPEDSGIGLILPAFIRGIWFDNVIACYILILPLTILSVSGLFNYYGLILWRGI